MAWIMELVRTGQLYDDRGRSLKIYHYIYSRREDDNDLVRSRAACRADLRRMGMLSGYTILHPWRGDHKKDATPAECRASMDRSHLSIHYHGIAIGHWSSRPHDMTAYVHVDKIMDVSMLADTDMWITLRRMLLARLQYDIGHAGWYGERGQSITSWGAPHVDEALIPPRPETYLRHPTMEVDGEPVWERRTAPEPEDWDDLRGEIARAMGLREELYDDKQYLQESMPRSGSCGESIQPWYALEEIEREEWHGNWLFWRRAISGAIAELMSSTRPP